MNIDKDNINEILLFNFAKQFKCIIERNKNNIAFSCLEEKLSYCLATSIIENVEFSFKRKLKE